MCSICSDNVLYQFAYFSNARVHGMVGVWRPNSDSCTGYDARLLKTVAITSMQSTTTVHFMHSMLLYVNISWLVWTFTFTVRFWRRFCERKTNIEKGLINVWIEL